MIVFGTRGKLLKTEPVVATCPNCNVHGQIFMSIYQRWAHIFWVPTFPIGKVGASVCSNCRLVLQHKEMPPELRMSYDNVKSATPTPIWVYSGLIVIALLFVAVALFGK